MPQSLGTAAYAQRLECIDFQCETLKIGSGDEAKNGVHKGTSGSIFWLKYPVHYQVVTITTTAGSSSITLQRAGGVSHSLNDTVHFTSLDVADVGGISRD
eukprot:2276218-Pleurochrysis_carterae.AAC.1